MKKLSFCFLLVAIIACQRQPERTTEINLEEITIDQLQDGYKNGDFTVVDVVKAYLKRIDDIDRHGPELNSIIMVNPDALQIASELDKEIAEGKWRSPMHGIPVILKDNIDTHDQMPCTAGATVLRNSFPLQDSRVAKKLRDAGAIILGKANLSEWANFRSSFSSSGWSGIGGQTKNPYVTDRNPCGSSSGSGVAVSANLCAIAIGTETDGSIVCPSTNNGIVGLKPTVGLISRAGIVPISFTQDTPGPMGRTVKDVAIALGTMTGIDSTDSKTINSQGRSYANYTQFLQNDGLQGKRIGLLRKSMGFHYRVDKLMEETVSFLKNQGAEVIDLDFELDPVVEKDEFQVLLYEFKDGLNAYFAGLGPDAPIGSLRDLIEFNKLDSVELRYFDQNLLETANAKGGLDSPEYLDALAAMQRATREDGIDRLLADNHLDALMLPTGAPAWKTDLIDGDHYMGGNSSLAAIAGYPSITVPMGFIHELPVGVSFIGSAWSEPMLFEIAYGYEQASKIRKSPKFLKE